MHFGTIADFVVFVWTSGDMWLNIWPFISFHHFVLIICPPLLYLLKCFYAAAPCLLKSKFMPMRIVCDILYYMIIIVTSVRSLNIHHYMIIFVAILLQELLRHTGCASRLGRLQVSPEVCALVLYDYLLVYILVIL